MPRCASSFSTPARARASTSGTPSRARRRPGAAGHPGGAGHAVRDQSDACRRPFARVLPGAGRRLFGGGRRHRGAQGALRPGRNAGVDDAGALHTRRRQPPGPALRQRRQPRPSWRRRRSRSSRRQSPSRPAPFSWAAATTSARMAPAYRRTGRLSHRQVSGDQRPVRRVCTRPSRTIARARPAGSSPRRRPASSIIRSPASPGMTRPPTVRGFPSKRAGVTGCRPRRSGKRQRAAAMRAPIHGARHEPDASRCNVGTGRTTAVDAHPDGCGPYGGCDMAGNVREWTSTLWGDDLRQARYTYPYRHDGREGAGERPNDLRICRGGAYDDSPALYQCSARTIVHSDARLPTVGFRVVLDR